MGVPLVVEVLPSGEQGYRVPPDEYFLPDLGLTAEETAGAARRGERGAARR